MAPLSKCCCCSLQAGVITIGALGLVFPTIGAGVVIYLMVLMGAATVAVQTSRSEQDKQVEDMKNLMNAFGGADNEEHQKNLANYDLAKDNADNLLGMGWGILLAVAVVLILYILMNVLLIIGAATSKPGLLIPWMAYTVLAMILNGCGLAYQAVAVSFNIALLFQLIVFVGLTGFMLLCVFSLYQEINERPHQDYQQPMQKM